jgi:hypothetical protein
MEYARATTLEAVFSGDGDSMEMLLENSIIVPLPTRVLLSWFELDAAEALLPVVSLMTVVGGEDTVVVEAMAYTCSTPALALRMLPFEAAGTR